MNMMRAKTMKPVMPKQTGVALVEFALILPLLLILTFVTTEYSRALFQYNILTKSVRDAARYLSVYDSTDTLKHVIAKNLVVYGKPSVTESDSPLVIGLSTSLVPDPVWQEAGTTAPVINTVTIRITGYVFQPLLTSAFGLNFGNLAYADISATMRAPS